MSIPTQDNCDLDNPREMFLWMLVNVSNSQVPLLFPRKVLEDISEQLFRCGARFHPEEQKIFYRPPKPPEDGSVWDSMGGEWVEAEQPGVRPESMEPSRVQAMLDVLDDRAKQEIKAELERRGF